MGQSAGRAAKWAHSSGKAGKVSKRRWVASKLDLLTQCIVENVLKNGILMQRIYNCKAKDVRALCVPRAVSPNILISIKCLVETGLFKKIIT